MTKFSSEVELARAVGDWATVNNWDVYREVHTIEGDIDLLCLQGKVMWIIETKMSLSSGLLAQCVKRLGFAHYVSAAVPQLKGDVDQVKQFYMDHHGIGLLTVCHPEDCRIEVVERRNRDGSLRGHRIGSRPDADVNWGFVVREEERPRITRPNDLGRGRRPRGLSERQYTAKRMAALRRFLRPEHKNLVAGAAGGNQLTPWKATLLDVKEYLQKHGPSTIDEIASHCPNHYGSGRAAKSGIHRMVAEIAEKDFVKVPNTKPQKWMVVDRN